MPFNNNEICRAQKIMQNAIALLELDLEGLTVLTEVGSKNFIYTPLIALMAKVKHVYAWTKDTAYGKGIDIVRDCLEVAKAMGLDCTKLTFAINERPQEHVKNADIITNSGMLRPLDNNLLINAKSTSVIPLMFEAWEWRPGEIDKEYCQNKGIKIGGTWENYPGLKIFDYCGVLSIKMMFEAGVEVFQSKILVWSSDHFGEVAAQAFRDCKAEVIVTNDNNVLKQHVDTLDSIFICDYHESRQIIGDEGLMDVAFIKEANPALVVVHLCGAVDLEACVKNDLFVYPLQSGRSTFMTYTLAHVGLNPVLKLQTAGLKVGELLFKNESHPLCQRVV